MLLDQILLNVPCPIFWKNLDGIFLGCNKLFLSVAGFHDYSQLVGKSDAQLPWEKYKDQYHKDDQYVITTGKNVTRVENIPLNGRIIISETTKTPLMQDGTIIGVLGICLDITDRKEKERLEIQSSIHKIEAKKQTEFKRLMSKVAHDIRSPLTALQMIIQSCDTLQDNVRIPINKATSQIQDISLYILSQYKNTENIKKKSQKKIKDIDLTPTPQNFSTLGCDEILEVVTAKRYEYCHESIDFVSHISKDGYFAFIDIDPLEFKRMLSNLINNSVEALPNKTGEISIYLEVIDKTKVQIIVKDNGCGMPDSVKEKLLKKITVTNGKENGHGIGFRQVQDTISEYRGHLEINSEKGKGTEVIITFAKIDLPDWICDKIEFYADDLLVILDDDSSIHSAWEAKFKQCAPQIKRQHFQLGLQAIDFINALPKEEKEKVFLLTDYELIRQGLQGLDVVQQTQIKRSVLVTSHHHNQKVRDLARQANTKILPKPLAVVVPIQAISMTKQEVDLSKIDIVLLEDESYLRDVIVDICHSHNRSITTYDNPDDILKNIDQYSKSTRFVLDNSIRNSQLTGVDVAKRLHNQGYERLFLFSGTYFSPSQLPDYIVQVHKRVGTNVAGEFVDTVIYS